jgi:hypothetical protein
MRHKDKTNSDTTAQTKEQASVTAVASGGFLLVATTLL